MQKASSGCSIEVGGKSPLHYSIATYVSFLIPMNMVSLPEKCAMRFCGLAIKFYSCKKIPTSVERTAKISMDIF